MERPVLTEDGSERRGWPRAPIRRTTRIVLRSGANFEARSFDISSSGLGVLCDQAIPKGELCAVGLTMLFADEVSDFFDKLLEFGPRVFPCSFPFVD